ncbi:MAG: thiolase family protein [Fimbriimonadaceae bacterium]|nr:thiolase family protein [Alphaproteobacteria bacterium]
MTSHPNSVVVAGGSVGKFGMFLDLDLDDLAKPVLSDVFKQSRVKPSDVQVAFVGNAFGGMLQQQESILGQVLLASVGISAVPIHNIKNACSSGADAAHLAWAAVAYGQVDCALVLGVEKLTHSDRRATFSALASASDRKPSSNGRSVFMDLNAERAHRYMEAYGATPHHFALCAIKNRAHAELNERAAKRTPLTLEGVLSDKVVIDPLTRAMCGGIADGAAAIVLVSQKFASSHGLVGPTIAASSVVAGIPEGGEANATARAGAQAYEMASIGPDEVSVAEVHDPTSPQELFDIEDLGLVPRGGSIAALEMAETSLGGRIPVNVSGGLTSRGHPVGATGVAQIVEIAEQLTGRAGKRQVEGATIGLAQMAGGLLGNDSAVAVVHILKQ